MLTHEHTAATAGEDVPYTFRMRAGYWEITTDTDCPDAMANLNQVSPGPYWDLPNGTSQHYHRQGGGPVTWYVSVFGDHTEPCRVTAIMARVPTP